MTSLDAAIDGAQTKVEFGRRDELAKKLCRASGHDPECPVRLTHEKQIVQTPMGRVEAVSYPETPVTPLWHYWRHQAQIAIDALEPTNA